ncbi:MAG: hypothetical protein DCC69_11915 [Hyphomicrobiales bacterium]|nr:MAG: hypothetical protein DCC69_11915 [Hyphomicrobiales bacterium]
MSVADMKDAPAAPPPAAPGQPVPLGDILARSLEALVAAGRIDAACSLAGLACAATRHTDMRQWKRFNALLHRWSAKAPEPGRPLAAAK